MTNVQVTHDHWTSDILYSYSVIANGLDWSPMETKRKQLHRWIIAFLIILSCEPGAPPSPVTGGAAPDPMLPRVFLNTQYSPPTGRTITVSAGGDFQAALDNAQPGDQIALAAGATYRGPFTLPAKSG